MTGVRVGRLVVQSRAHRNKNLPRAAEWVCRCDCGRRVIAIGGNLRKDRHTMSCGCLNSDRVRARNLSHGLTGTPEWKAWTGMRVRCARVKGNRYHRYGGRGISVCKRWLNFQNFLSDMGQRPTGCSLDRINNDGNYEPSNCRWATRSEQARNRRNNRHVIAFGKSKLLVEWSEEYGIGLQKLWSRLKKGWTPERALTQP